MALLEPFAAINLVLIGFLMIGLGASISPVEVKAKLKSPRPLLFAMACQFLLFPLIGFAAIRLLGRNLEDHFRVAITIVVSCPGGSLSNMICYLVHADLPLSLTMTAASSLAGIFMIPVSLYLYLEVAWPDRGPETVNLDWASIAVTAAVIVAGISVGLYVRSSQTKLVSRRVEIFGLCAGLSTFIVAMWRNSQSETGVIGMPAAIYPTIALIVGTAAVVVFLAAHYLMRLPKPSSVAVFVETVSQNTNLALALISVSVDDQGLVDEMVGVVIVWSLFHSAFSLLPALALQRLGWTDLPKEQNPFTQCCVKPEDVGAVADFELATNLRLKPTATGTTTLAASSSRPHSLSA